MKPSEKTRGKILDSGSPKWQIVYDDFDSPTVRNVRKFLLTEGATR